MKAFIFDLDGIIVDTAKYHFKSWKIISKNFGFELSKTQNELLKGVSREESLDRILSWAGISIDKFEKGKIINICSAELSGLVMPFGFAPRVK